MQNDRQNRTKRLVASGLFAAVGILLPQVFHLIGGPAAGGMFLPMHIPVLLAGILLGPFYGAAVGMVSPVVSCLLTSMPSPVKLPFMLLELLAYGIISGLLSRRKLPVYVSLIGAQVAGRAVYALCLLVAAGLFQLDVPPVLSVWTALITGLPGIVIQLLLIPLIVIPLRKVALFHD